MNHFYQCIALSFIEEDNVQRAYFRLQPLLTAEGDATEHAKAIFPDDGCLRVVPDKREQGTFKDRMRRLGQLCAIDLTAYGPESSKIRTNKNYASGYGERNQYIIYSDVVHSVARDMAYEVVTAATPEQALPFLARATTPTALVLIGETYYGPLTAAAGADLSAWPVFALDEKKPYGVTFLDGSIHTYVLGEGMTAAVRSAAGGEKAEPVVAAGALGADVVSDVELMDGVGGASDAVRGADGADSTVGVRDASVSDAVRGADGAGDASAGASDASASDAVRGADGAGDASAGADGKTDAAEGANGAGGTDDAGEPAVADSADEPNSAVVATSANATDAATTCVPSADNTPSAETTPSDESSSTINPETNASATAPIAPSLSPTELPPTILPPAAIPPAEQRSGEPPAPAPAPQPASKAPAMPNAPQPQLTLPVDRRALRGARAGVDEPLSGTMLLPGAQQNARANRRNTALYQIVDEQVRGAARYPDIGASIQQGAALRPIDNPAETFRASLHTLWAREETRAQVLQLLQQEPALVDRLENTAHAGSTDTPLLRAACRQLEEMESERIRQIMQLEQARRDAAAYRRTVADSLLSERNNEIAALQQRIEEMTALKENLAVALENMTRTLRAQRDESAALRRVHDANVTATAVLSPRAGGELSFELLVDAISQEGTAAGFDLREDDAANAALLLSLFDTVSLCHTAPSEAVLFADALVRALGLSRESAVLYTPRDVLVAPVEGADTPVVAVSAFVRAAAAPSEIRLFAGASPARDVGSALYAFAPWPLLFCPASTPLEHTAPAKERAPVSLRALREAAARGTAGMPSESSEQDVRGWLTAVRDALADAGVTLSPTLLRQMERYMSSAVDRLIGGFLAAADFAALQWIVPLLMSLPGTAARVRPTFASLPRTMARLYPKG